MAPFLNNLQKLIALMSIEAIGTTDENRFILKEDSGSCITVEKIDYPGGYALFNRLLNKEMLRVEYRNNELLEVHILYTSKTYEIQLLRNENNKLKGGIITGSALHQAITIVVNECKAKYITYSLEVSTQKNELAIAA